MVILEKTCSFCCFWQPNGGILELGYCRLFDFTYRKASQSCDKYFSLRDFMTKCFENHRIEPKQFEQLSLF